MRFELNDEQKLLQKTAKNIMQRDIRPVVDRLKSREAISKDVLRG